MAEQPWFSKTHPAKELHRLIGTWRHEAMIPGFEKPFVSTVRCTWIKKDLLLLMKSTGKKGGPPSATAVIGADDTNNKLEMLYCDARGVTRIYDITLNKTEFCWERKAKGFSQKLVCKFSKDGRSINGEAFKAVNGGRMQHDMMWIYQRTR
ncbi:MAG TPA: hypothetical protein VGM90_13760 [Kofleriaceae bacterium]|jgi:hypothetical protein